MRQQAEADNYYSILFERNELKRKWEAHKRGEIVLTEDEIEDMVVEMIMIKDALR